MVLERLRDGAVCCRRASVLDELLARAAGLLLGMGEVESEPQGPRWSQSGMGWSPPPGAGRPGGAAAWASITAGLLLPPTHPGLLGATA